MIKSFKESTRSKEREKKTMYIVHAAISFFFSMFIIHSTVVTHTFEKKKWKEKEEENLENRSTFCIPIM